MLEPKYLTPPSIRALKCSASAPIVVSAKMPITIPRIVKVLRSLRRARFRRISMLHSHLRCRLATPGYERTIQSRRSLARQNRAARSRPSPIIHSVTWQPELDDLRHREQLARQMGGPDRVARQHAAGRLTVRERSDRLLDRDSFEEYGALAG